MTRFPKAFLLLFVAGSIVFAQAPQRPAQPAPSDDKASAYYNFAMGRLYAELAANEAANRAEYINKSIHHYQDALKADPSAGIIFEELIDLLMQTNRTRDAIAQAEELLQKNPDDADARRALGRIYLHMADNPSGRVDEASLRRAIEQFQKLTEKNPKDVEAWVTLGKLHSALNNSPEAEKAFKSALDADPDNEDAVTQMAELYGRLGDNKRAIELLKTAAAKHPTASILISLAEEYEQAEDTKSAADARKKAMDLAPDDGRNIRMLAADLMYSDQLDAALQLWEHIASEEPRDPSAPLNLSRIYIAKRDLPKAREALNHAKVLDPQNLDIRYQEIKLLEAEGKNDQAMASLKTVLDETARRTYSEADARRRANLLEEYGVLLRGQEKYPQAVDVFRQMGTLSTEVALRSALQVVDTYRQAKDYDTALKEADAAIKKFPNERGLKVQHATVLAESGKVDAAATEMRGMLKGDHDRETYIALAQMLEKAKRFNDADEALNNAEKLSSTNDEKEAVYFTRGALFERMKRFDQSEAEFRKVLELNAENAGALNYLGYMLADRNVRLDEAARLVKKALELDPDNGAYLDSMGWVLYRQGKLDEAQSLLLKALDHIGQDPTVHDHLGDVYIKAGKTKEAIAQWQASVKAYQAAGSQSDTDSDDMAKVTKKLDAARIRLAQETKK